MTKIIALLLAVGLLTGCYCIGKVDTMKTQTVMLNSRSALQDTEGNPDMVDAVDVDGGGSATVPFSESSEY